MTNLFDPLTPLTNDGTSQLSYVERQGNGLKMVKEAKEKHLGPTDSIREGKTQVSSPSIMVFLSPKYEEGQ